MKAADVLFKIKDSLTGIFGKFTSLLYPKSITCVGCGAELIAETRYDFCSKCYAELPFVGDNKCKICGRDIVGEGDYCDSCTRFDCHFSVNRAPLVYDGLAKTLIKKLKFGNKRYIAAEFGKMMADLYISENYDADCISFVPMTSKDEKKRGYNQAELIANEVGKRLNIEVLPVLHKISSTATQKKLTAKERRENLKGAFAASDCGRYKGKTVLVVDDVFTTGATMDECARVLKKSGAKKVLGLTACISEYKVAGEINADAVN